MLKKKKALLLVGIIFVTLGFLIMTISSIVINQKKKSVNNSNNYNTNNNLNNNQITNNNVDNKDSVVNNNDYYIDLAIKEEKVDYSTLSDDEKLLYDFGFYEKIGCGNIFTSTYSEEFKKNLVLKKVNDSDTIIKKCSEIYSESQLDGNNYKTNYGVCNKDSDTKLIPYDIANNIYKKMYNSDMSKSGFTTLSLNGTYYNFYDYSESLNSFVKLECGACGGSCSAILSILSIKSSEEINNKKYINVYGFGGFLRALKKDDNSVLVVEDSNQNKLELKSKDYENAKNEILNEHLDKVGLYEIVFNKVNDYYVFESFSKK